MKDKVKITFVDGEDRQLLLKPNGDELCSIDRDQDSFSAAVKVIRSLGIGTVWDDGSEIEL